METKKLHIGEKLRTHLKEKGMSVAALALRMGTTPRNIRYMLERERLSLSVLRRLSVVLQTDLLIHYLQPQSRELYLQALKNNVPALLAECDQLRKQSATEAEANAEEIRRLQSLLSAKDAELNDLRIRHEALEKLNAELKSVIVSLSART